MNETVALVSHLGGNLGPWLGGAIVIGISIRSILNAWFPFEKIKVDRDGAVIAQLTARVTSLESQALEQSARADKERSRLEDKIEAQRQLHEIKLEAERVRNEIEVAKMRHRANGADQCLDAFVMLLEAEDSLSPKVMRALAAVKEMRERQREQQAAESAAMIQAKATLATGAAPVPVTATA